MKMTSLCLHYWYFINIEITSKFQLYLNRENSLGWKVQKQNLLQWLVPEAVIDVVGEDGNGGGFPLLWHWLGWQSGSPYMRCRWALGWVLIATTGMPLQMCKWQVMQCRESWSLEEWMVGLPSPLGSPLLSLCAPASCGDVRGPSFLYFFDLASLQYWNNIKKGKMWNSIFPKYGHIVVH